MVKGGKRFAMAAMVIVGDGKGRVGLGTGKAREVPEASARRPKPPSAVCAAFRCAKAARCITMCAAVTAQGKVVLRTAPAGTGIIAGGPMRAVFEALGIHDVVAKSVGSSNPHNMIKATFNALDQVSSPRSVAMRRGKKVNEILGKKQAGAEEGKQKGEG